MSLIYFSLSVFSCLDSLLILGEQLPIRLDVDEKDNGEKPGPFLQWTTVTKSPRVMTFLQADSETTQEPPRQVVFKCRGAGGGGLANGSHSLLSVFNKYCIQNTT